MKKDKIPDELRPRYDREELGAGVRGKYLDSFKSGTNIVLLSPDVAAVFNTDDAVNDTLRGLIELANKCAKPSSGKTPTARKRKTG